MMDTQWCVKMNDEIFRCQDELPLVGFHGRRINSDDVIGKIGFLDVIGIIRRSTLFVTTLVRTNWYHDVVLPRLVLDAMGFTSTIKQLPQEKERLEYRIGPKWYLKKYYEYLYSLASKADFDQNAS